MATITEDYCSYEVAKMLKEKGFLKEEDLKITQNLSFYDNIGLHHNLNKWYDSLIQDKIDFVVAPTHQMAKKWLREEHNLYVEIFVTWRDKIPHYQWRINNLITQDTIVDTPCLEKPEEAAEAAIKYSLENLI